MLAEQVVECSANKWRGEDQATARPETASATQAARNRARRVTPAAAVARQAADNQGRSGRRPPAHWPATGQAVPTKALRRANRQTQRVANAKARSQGADFTAEPSPRRPRRRAAIARVVVHRRAVALAAVPLKADKAERAIRVPAVLRVDRSRVCRPPLRTLARATA